MTNMTYEIKLTPEEAILLDGRVGAEAQIIVDKAKDALSFAGIGDPFLAEVVRLVKEHGRLEYRWRDIGSCRSCKKSTTYAVFKSGRRRGQSNYKSPIGVYGVSFMDGFVITRGYSSRGLCSKCGEPALKRVTDFILANDLPVEIYGSQTKYVREGERVCRKCEQPMWEFDMKPERTIMGDGYYYGGCPNCKTVGSLFSSHSSSKNYRVVPVVTLSRCGNLWVRPSARDSASGS